MMSLHVIKTMQWFPALGQRSMKLAYLQRRGQDDQSTLALSLEAAIWWLAGRPPPTMCEMPGFQARILAC